MQQHRGIYLEHNKIAGTIEPAIDTEIFKTDALTDRAQYPVMLGIENCGGGVQKSRLLPLHPLVIDHFGAVVMHLSVARSRAGVRQNMIVHQNETRLAEITNACALIDRF